MSEAPTVTAAGSRAGLLSQASLSSLPAATTTWMPASVTARTASSSCGCTSPAAGQARTEWTGGQAASDSAEWLKCAQICLLQGTRASRQAAWGGIVHCAPPSDMLTIAGRRALSLSQSSASSTSDTAAPTSGSGNTEEGEQPARVPAGQAA